MGKSTWSLRAKLYFAFFLQALGTLAVGFTAFWSIQTVSAAYQHVSRVNLAKAQEVSNLRYSSSQVARILARLAMPGSSDADVERLTGKFKKSVEAYDRASQTYGTLAFAEGEKEKYESTVREWKRMVEVATNAVQLIGTKKPEDREAAVRLIQKDIKEIGETQGKELEALAELQNADAKKWVEAASTAEARGNRLTLTLVIGGFLASLLVARAFSRRLTESLSLIVEWLSGGALKVASASQQISEASTELSQGANEQAAAVQQTASSMQEISAMVVKNADNARESQDLSYRSRQAVDSGRGAVGKVIQSINEIRDANGDMVQQIQASNQQFSEIMRVIEEIGQKTKVINDIVFQTKLLSFNASVEAARAGEHGRGFAVVAEEVGNLAQMSGNAAKEINQLLSESIQRVDRIVVDTRTRVDQLVTIGAGKVKNGVDVAQQCAVALDEIVHQVTSVGDRVNQIANASEEQARGVEEITKAMNQLDQVTQQNARVSLDSAAASEVLTSQAHQLRSLIEDLKVLTHGSDGAGNVVTEFPQAPSAPGGSRSAGAAA